MSYWDRANRVTFGDLGNNLEVEDQGTVTVHGISVDNDTGSGIRATFSDSNNFYIHSMSVPANDSKCCDIMFLADSGIKADALSSDVYVTFFHSNKGA
jgi:hypothetical protein